MNKLDMNHDWTLPYVNAHRKSSNHRAEIKASIMCGCFYCLAIFISSDIIKWIDIGTTAICPHCGIDAVIGSESGFPITKEFLNQMKIYWFSATVNLKSVIV
jgi:hypothetical protein